MTKIENITTPKASISSQHCGSFRFHCQTIHLYIGFYHKGFCGRQYFSRGKYSSSSSRSKMYLQHLIRDHCIQEDKFWDECEITYCYFRVSRRKWEIDNYFSLSKNQADSSENSWDREFQFCCGLKPIGVIFDKDINIPTTTYTCIWAHYWQPHNKESEIKKRLLKCDQSADGHHHGHHLVHSYDT